MRNALIGAALLVVAAPGAALAFDGSVALGLTFDNQGMLPFADMEGTRGRTRQRRLRWRLDLGTVPLERLKAGSGGGGALTNNPGRSSAPGRGVGHGYGSLKLR